MKLNIENEFVIITGQGKNHVENRTLRKADRSAATARLAL